MAGWVEACVHRWGHRGASLAPSLLAPWIELLGALGPTPRRGPLTHDWLLPRPGGPFGLNLFPEDGALLGEVLRITVVAIGGDAPRALRELADEAAGLRWAAGIEGRRDTAKIKLWLLGDVVPLATRWGLPTEGLVALGVDVSPAGRSRRRTYVRWEDASDRGPLGAAWDAVPPPVGLSHRLLARLDGQKWSYDHVFAPDAPLDGLREARRSLATGCEGGVDLAFCGAVEAALDPWGLRLRAAAFELDRYEDGRVATDALVTVGAG